MKKYFSKRKNMQLAALVVSGLLSASAADAADLVVTVPSDYTNSELGTVSGSRVTTHIDAETHKAVMQGLGGDFAPFNYHQQGKSISLRAAIRTARRTFCRPSCSTRTNSAHPQRPQRASSPPYRMRTLLWQMTVSST